jgi:hypothetical protein
MIREWRSALSSTAKVISGVLALWLAGGCMSMLGSANNPPAASNPDMTPDPGMQPPMQPPPPPPPPPPQQQPTPTALQAFQNSFYPFAVATCGGCHSDKPNQGVLVPQNPLFASSIPTFAYVVAKPFVDFKNPANSLLAQYAGNGHCGIPSVCGSASAAVATLLTTWVAGDTPLPAPTVRNPVSDLETLQLIKADMALQPTATQPFLRYFTLEAYGNTAGRPTLVAVEMQRSALIKMINMVSTGRMIVQPTAIDTDGLIYRVDMRQLNWSATSWTNLKATDVYFVAADFPTTLATAATQTLRADWFVYSMKDSPINAYLDFLGINSDDPHIDALNNVDRFGSMAKGYPAMIRSGFNTSRTETFNRVIEWYPTTSLGSGAIGSGHLFKSYNHASNVAPENIFTNPYRPTTNLPVGTTPGPYDFPFGDSDNVFSLPNGLPGWYTTEPAAGVVASVASTGAGFPGVTRCFQCHDNNTATQPFVDQVHAALAADPVGTFPAALTTLLLGMYNQTEMDKRLAAAGTQWGGAIASLKLPSIDIAGSPSGLATEVMNIVFNNHTISLQVDTAAAEIGVTVTQLLSAIKATPALVAPLAGLTSVDATGNPNGVVRRDNWEANYAAVRKALFPQL